MKKTTFACVVAVVFGVAAVAGLSGLTIGAIFGYDEGYRDGLGSRGLKVPRGDDLSKVTPIVRPDFAE
jgi:hypothetical protein